MRQFIRFQSTITKPYLNQHAIITGGSQGLGWSIAQRLSSKGCKVTLLSRDENKLIDKVGILNQLNPLPNSNNCKHDYISYDLNDYMNIDTFIKQNYNDYKKINILVNCAGVSQHGLLINMTNEEIANIMNINLLSPIILSKLFAKTMMRLKNANIINISSILAKDNVKGTAIYSISKIGLTKLSENLAFEMKKRNIRCNSILPGLIAETEIGRDVNKELMSDEANSGITCENVTDLVEEMLLNEDYNGQSKGI